MATEELCLICWARGRGGMNLGPGGFSSNFINNNNNNNNNNNSNNNINNSNNNNNNNNSNNNINNSNDNEPLTTATSPTYAINSNNGRNINNNNNNNNNMMGSLGVTANRDMGVIVSNRGKTNMNGGRRMGMNRMTVVNSKTGHSVHMRGLPFEATAADVIRFFAPLQPVDIRLLYESNTGRPKGECDVDFTTHHHAEEAMKKDKQNMGHRYIELFLKSTVHGNGKWNNNVNSIKGSPPLLHTINNNNNNNNNNNRQPTINSLYVGGYNNNGQTQLANQNRFSNNVLPPIGCNFNNNGTSPPVLEFGKPPIPVATKSQMDLFVTKEQHQQRQLRNEFKGGDQGLGLVGRTIQNGGVSTGTQSFYSSVIH